MKGKDYTKLQAQIYFALEQAKAPIPKETLCQNLMCSPHEFDQEKKALVKAGELYHCQDGMVLKEYATYDQQLWHLSWSLGLLETSSIHVTLDKDLLELAPQALQTLIVRGKMDANQGRILNDLKNKLLSAMEAPKILLQTYHKIEKLLNDHIESKTIGDGKTKLTELKDLKKYKKDFED